ncbi:MAG: hypothetical protein QE263_02025 [Vampirovibrionales bacterium]|nr:hypothetical protein [Vampirovibrionales bacterium]
MAIATARELANQAKQFASKAIADQVSEKGIEGHIIQAPITWTGQIAGIGNLGSLANAGSTLTRTFSSLTTQNVVIGLPGIALDWAYQVTNEGTIYEK